MLTRFKVIRATLNRKATFLESDVWRTLPFTELQITPLQSLLSIAASVPSLLEAIDQLGTRESVAACRETASMTLRRLESWRESYEDSLRQDYSFELSDSPQTHDICYPDITVANCMTHYYAFRIICVFYMQRLSQSGGAVDRHATTSVDDNISDMAQLIVMSVRYLLGKGMGLYGPISVLLPAKVAYECLCQDAAALPPSNNTNPSDYMLRIMKDAGHQYLCDYLTTDAINPNPILTPNFPSLLG